MTTFDAAISHLGSHLAAALSLNDEPDKDQLVLNHLVSAEQLLHGVIGIRIEAGKGSLLQAMLVVTHEASADQLCDAAELVGHAVDEGLIQ